MAQIDAHIGGVNDIAFSHPNKTLSIITCGDDKLIKVRSLIWYTASPFLEKKKWTPYSYDTLLYPLEKMNHGCTFDFGRYGMLRQDKSSTHLKVTKLQYILFALTTRSQFRYFRNTSIYFLRICFCRFNLQCVVDLIFLVSAFHCHFHDKYAYCILG